MNAISLADLQTSVQDRSAFKSLTDFARLGEAFLEFVAQTRPTRVVSPTHHNYFFYQYSEASGYKITRPLNADLFIESTADLKSGFDRLIAFLGDLRVHQDQTADRAGTNAYIASNEINKVIYTVQQTIGCVSDSLENSNQARKRVGQLFEALVKFVIQEVGLTCEQRTIRLPVPGYSELEMSYELDMVFSRGGAVVTAETRCIQHSEIVGSVKTTSKDRIDKIFLDKFLLTRLLGREIPVVAVFLHDVQRAVRGESIFGINSTFKSNHFLGYTVALNRLDGVYYVDPRPEMWANPRLRDLIGDFRQFLVSDLWRLSAS